MIKPQRLALIAVCAMAVAACAPAPDLDGSKAERAKPVQRYDNFQGAASNGKQLVSAGGGGVLVTSSDSGTNWSRVQLPTPSSIVGMSACADGSFAALDFYRKVWMGDAQGSNWQPRAIDEDFNPVAIECDAKNRLWVVGSFSTILSSSDQGQTWNAQPPGDDAILTTVQFLDEQRGFIGGEFGTLLVTSDGGRSWTKQAGLPEEFYPYALHFADTQRGWVSGLAGAILHTQDGGQTWARQANGSGSAMYALLDVGDQLLGVGAGGRVLTLAGEQWVPLEQAPQFPSYLAAGAPLEAQAVLVAGAAGALGVLKLTTQLAQSPEVMP